MSLLAPNSGDATGDVCLLYIDRLAVMLLMYRPLCSGDVLQVEKCGETADEWRLIKLKDTIMWALVLGPNNQFIACWDTGDNVRDPYKKKAHPVLKKPFPAGKYPGMGCGWRKVTHLPPK